ncbi:hypothetical protein V8E55_000765 [Tylopilus felleus]
MTGQAFLKGKWNDASRSYLPFDLFPLLYVGARFYYRTPQVKPEDMDFVTDIAQVEADEEPGKPPQNKMDAFWQWLAGFSTVAVFASAFHTFGSRCNYAEKRL